MTGEELNRKWHVMNGLKLDEVHDGVYHPCACGLVYAKGGGKYLERIEVSALHLDANLLIAELDRVFSRGWSCERTPFTFSVWGPRGHAMGSADTFCEAGLAALIASI